MKNPNYTLLEKAIYGGSAIFSTTAGCGLFFASRRRSEVIISATGPLCVISFLINITYIYYGGTHQTKCIIDSTFIQILKNQNLNSIILIWLSKYD